MTGTVLVVGGTGMLGTAVTNQLHRLTYISHSLASPDAPSADLRAKALAERAIASSGVPYTIFWPTYVIDSLRRHVRGDQAVILGTQPTRCT